MGGAGGNLGGTLAAVGKGAPVVSPRSNDESANGRPLRGGRSGGFRRWDHTGMIIYGQPATGLAGRSTLAGMPVIHGARVMGCSVVGT